MRQRSRVELRRTDGYIEGPKKRRSEDNFGSTAGCDWQDAGLRPPSAGVTTARGAVPPVLSDKPTAPSVAPSFFLCFSSSILRFFALGRRPIQRDIKSQIRKGRHKQTISNVV